MRRRFMAFIIAYIWIINSRAIIGFLHVIQLKLSLAKQLKNNIYVNLSEFCQKSEQFYVKQNKIQIELEKRRCLLISYDSE